MNNPHFYDFVKVYCDGANYAPGETGTIGVLVLNNNEIAVAAQNLGTGDLTASVVGVLTLTPRGTTTAFTDYTNASIAIDIWSHGQPYFIPGDFENIQVSTVAVRYIVITRKIRNYES